MFEEHPLFAEVSLSNLAAQREAKRRAGRDKASQVDAPDADVSDLPKSRR